MRYSGGMSTHTPTPPHGISAAEHAYAQIKGRIIRGELAGGTAVSELALAEELEVSRTPVHEAFLRLAAEQLITLEARKGAVIRPMAPHEARNVLEMREAIEGAAGVRLISDGAAHTAVDALAELVEVQRAAANAGDVDAFLAADDVFHATVVERSGNDLAIQLMGTLRDRQQRLRYQLLRVRPEHLWSGLAQHEQLVSALRHGDTWGYRNVLAEHIASHQGAM